MGKTSMFEKSIHSVAAAMLAIVVSQAAWAQQPSPDVEQLDETPVFTVTTVARTTNAVNYRYRRSNTDVDFVGTSLAPFVTGVASVKSRPGSIELDVEFEGLKPANDFGAEYLTYVLWAITPQGRAINLGEVRANGRGRAELTVTSELQTFGMIMTAEPYFAVRRPSDLLVAENEIRDDNKGEVEPVQAEYELFRRGDYARLPNVLGLTVDLKDYPLDLYQARNAIQIAGGLQAVKYARETLNEAVAELDRANALARDGKSKRDVSTVARNAVQIAEDARELTEQRIEQEIAENQRIAAEEARFAAERAQIAAQEAEEQQRQEAEMRAKAEQAQSEAERRSLEAELAEARARAEMEKALREKEEAQRLISRARVDAEAARAEQANAAVAVTEMRAERQQLQEAKEAADLAARVATQERDELRIERQQLQEAKEAADLAARVATQERDEMRNRMQDALSKVVATQESARGLILNLPDILFDFGKAQLQPEAREVLSRIAGIMMVTPGYHLLIEGHTDSVGSDEFNQKLSEDRAKEVYTYMSSVDVDPALMTTEGFGKSNPVASNDAPAGRQQNRRVEIIIQDDNAR